MSVWIHYRSPSGNTTMVHSNERGKGDVLQRHGWMTYTPLPVSVEKLVNAAREAGASFSDFETNAKMLSKMFNEVNDR